MSAAEKLRPREGRFFPRAVARILPPLSSPAALSWIAFLCALPAAALLLASAFADRSFRLLAGLICGSVFGLSRAALFLRAPRLSAALGRTASKLSSLRRAEGFAFFVTFVFLRPPHPSLTFALPRCLSLLRRLSARSPETLARLGVCPWAAFPLSLPVAPGGSLRSPLFLADLWRQALRVSGSPGFPDPLPRESWSLPWILSFLAASAFLRAYSLLCPRERRSRVRLALEAVGSRDALGAYLAFADSPEFGDQRAFLLSWRSRIERASLLSSAQKAPSLRGRDRRL